jgi:CBS domain-containing protein
MNIRDLMTPDIDVVTPEDTLRTAAGLMAELDIDALPVIEHDRLVGEISGRDIAVRVAAEGCDPQEVRVEQAMSPDVLYCFGGESIAEVAEKMAGWWVTRLAVVDEDRRPIGLVSLAELSAPTPPLPTRETKAPERKHRRVHSVRRERRSRRAAA